MAYDTQTWIDFVLLFVLRLSFLFCKFAYSYAYLFAYLFRNVLNYFFGCLITHFFVYISDVSWYVYVYLFMCHMLLQGSVFWFGLTSYH